MTFSVSRIPRPLVLGSLALVIGLVAAVFLALHVHERVRQAEEQARLPMVERIVAANDLPAGTRLLSEHLAVRQFPAQWVGRDTLPAARYAELEGRLLTAPLRAGDAIATAHVRRPQSSFSAQLAPGRRAITLPVDQVNSLSGLLQPGDLIDLYVSFDYQRKRLTAPLLQGVLVLATGQETGLDGLEQAGQSYSTVTLDAAPDDVVKLVAARQAGSLTAILRHPEDARADRRASRGDLAALLGVSAPAPKPSRKAVILYGDSTARAAMPAWAVPGKKTTPLNNGLFDLPVEQFLSAAWARAMLESSEFPADPPRLNGLPSSPPDMELEDLPVQAGPWVQAPALDAPETLP